jgi:hypothetical protein
MVRKLSYQVDKASSMQMNQPRSVPTGLFNKSTTTYSAQISPSAHGEDTEGPDFQDDQLPASISDQCPGLL